MKSLLFLAFTLAACASTTPTPERTDRPPRRTEDTASEETGQALDTADTATPPPDDPPATCEDGYAAGYAAAIEYLGETCVPSMCRTYGAVAAGVACDDSEECRECWFEGCDDGFWEVYFDECPQIED